MKNNDNYKGVLPGKIFEDLHAFFRESGKDVMPQTSEPGREKVVVTIKDKYLVDAVNLDDHTVYTKNDYLNNTVSKNEEKSLSFSYLKPASGMRLKNPIKVGSMRSLSTVVIENAPE